MAIVRILLARPIPLWVALMGLETVVHLGVSDSSVSVRVE